MLTCYSLLPSLDIEKLSLTVNPLELECFRIYPLALHLTCDNGAFESNDSEVVTVGSLDNDHIPYLYALTGAIAEDGLAGILETNLEQILILLLTDSLQPVIHLKLAAALTIGAIHLAGLRTLHYTTSGAVVSLYLIRFCHTLKNILLTRSQNSIFELTFLSIMATTFSILVIDFVQKLLPTLHAILS